jgi:nucleotide-binding universal stress UspA family protein
MIAMSTRARRGLSAAFHSSVATKVLHQVNIPLLLLRSEIKE